MGGLGGGLQTASHPRKELINLGTKKGQRRKTARRAYSGWEVTAQVTRRGKRAVSQKFKTKTAAKKYARTTAKARPGSNPRVRRVR